MIRNILLFLLITVGAHAQQFSFEHWHNGKVIIEGGDTLKGLVKYNLQQDIVQCQCNGSVETFTARKAVYFEIFDAITKEYRHFFSLPFAASGQYKAPIFFELLAEGKMTLLSREALEYKTYSSFYYYGSYTRLVLVYKYFLLEENGELKEFQGNKNDWLYQMGNQAEKVQRYVKINRLDFAERSELTKIISYYNSLFEK